jgi:hypothetical protein
MGAIQQTGGQHPCWEVVLPTKSRHSPNLDAFWNSNDCLIICSPLGTTATISDLRYTVCFHKRVLAYRKQYAVTRKSHGTHRASDVVVHAVHMPWMSHHRDRRVQGRHDMRLTVERSAEVLLHPFPAFTHLSKCPYYTISIPRSRPKVVIPSHG